MLFLLAVPEVRLRAEVPPKGYSCTVSVRDAATGEPLGYAVVSAKARQGTFERADAANGAGICTLHGLPAGTYTLRVTFLGYLPSVSEVEITRNLSLDISLRVNVVEIGEVVVTASESRGMTSASLIDRKAMEHLQPSSFTDLLELLPGGRALPPDLNEPNQIRLREAGGTGKLTNSYYENTSFGTSFLMDGAPIASRANLQLLSGASNDERDFVGEGVDMRSISTDEIEHVEIVRGIPSVEYGELTSGLVKITRRRGGNDLRARFKADAESKLFSVGKGFEWERRRLTLNAGLDLLNAKADPRNTLENYKRLTGSLRLSKGWDIREGLLTYESNLDYSGSFDNEKIDPEINFHKEDRYKSSYNRYAWANNLRWKGGPEGVLRSLDLYTSLSLQKDLIERTRQVQLSRDTPAPLHDHVGVYDGLYLPYNYVASHQVDGRPLNAFVKLVSVLRADIGKVFNEIKAGADWTMDKNLGRGQIYDPYRPVYADVTTRPRPYRDIPAEHTLAFFAEDHTLVPVGNHKLELLAGLRASTLLNLPRNYAMRGQFSFDPRVNLKWIFPTLTLAGRPLVFELGGGIGWLSQAPSISDLYPNLSYYDLIQLNYYHPNPDYRRLNLKTTVRDHSNPNLAPARNRKWEVRADISWGGNRLSVDYFREKSDDWFRSERRFMTIDYRKYDPNSIDYNTLTGPPRLEEMTYTADTALIVYAVSGNGTLIAKEGVEFQFTSVRIPSIRTRVTVNGAWLRTTYCNSLPYYKASSKIVNNKDIPYLGLYEDPDGNASNWLTTNFTFDTDIPSLKLGFSLSAQCLWYYYTTPLYQSGIPVAYVDKQGLTHPYTEASKQDPYLKFLMIPHNDEYYKRNLHEPFNINFNLKVTKRLYRERINLAFFVNRLFVWKPDYWDSGVKIRTSTPAPYFGMELNFSL